MTANIQTGAYSFDDATTLTVASGVLTVTQAVHIVACESGTTDDIDTINVPSAMATPVTLYLRSDSGDTNTLKHGTGNIILPGGTDVDIDDDTIVQLLHNGTSVYLVGASSAGGSGAPTDATYITQTANGTLTNEQALGSLATGLMMSTTTTGVVSTIKHNSGQYAPTGRLSLSSTLAVPVASLTAQTTLYYHPFSGDTIWLYSGSQWLPHTFASAISIAIPATTNTNYDVFVYDNAGTLTLELLVWTNDTTRVALGSQNGWTVRGSDATRLYVGTIRTDGTSGQCSLDFGNVSPRMNIWNRFHQTLMSFTIQELTNSWTYAVDDVWRAANGSNANRVTFVIGLDINRIYATVGIYGSSNTYIANGVALDATNTNHAQIFGAFVDANGSTVWSQYRGYSGVGSHFLQWVESQEGTTTTTWYGDNTDTNIQAGMIVDMWG